MLMDWPMVRLLWGKSILGIVASRQQGTGNSEREGGDAPAIPHSPFPIPHSPFPIPHSPFPIPRSPLPIPRSPFPYNRLLPHSSSR